MRRCTVYGIYRDAQGNPAQGWISIKPERSGQWGKETVSEAGIRIRAEADGAWSVPLVPSQAVGTYTFSMAGLTFKVEVPTMPRARFDRLLEQADEEGAE